MNVGLEMGLKIEQAVHAIKRIEAQIDLLRMDNADLDVSINLELLVQLD